MLRIIAIMTACAALAAPLQAQMRTQTVALEKGWNAVWLEVQPEFTAPLDIFGELPVDIVAGYVTPVSESQFVKNKAVNLQSLSGWNVWYAPHRADAPLSRLQQLNANTGYLVHALEPATLTVRGEATGARIRWTPNRFNLVGFSVAERGGPTFRQFFQGSAAHNHNKIYRLANGVWRQVLNPDSEAFRSGEAFWMYCNGSSDYQGPLLVKANSPLGLALNGSSKSNLEFRNMSPHPLAFTLEQVAAEGNAALPLAAVIKSVVTNTVGLVDTPVDLPDHQAFPGFNAGEGMTLPVTLRVAEMQPGSYAGLLKVTTDLGAEVWVPVQAVRE